MVKSKPLLHLLDESVPYKKNLREGLKPSVDRQSGLLYVKSFFRKDFMAMKKNINNYWLVSSDVLWIPHLCALSC